MSRLTWSQIEEIITLHNKGLSQRAISKLKWYGRKTIAKYIKLYDAVVYPDIRIYSVSLFWFWMITIWVILLVGTLIHYLINHV